MDNLSELLAQTHWECNCVPELGPPHCHKCSIEAEAPVRFEQCPSKAQGVLMKLFQAYKAKELSWEDLIHRARELEWSPLVKVSNDESYYETDVNPAVITAAVVHGLLTQEEKRAFLQEVSD